MVRNSAFVFLKPAAVTDKMKELVTNTCKEKGLKILKEGSIDAATIDKKQLIDKHYYAIASKATLLTPDKLNVPKDKFKEQFGLEWADVLKDGKALNAKEACDKFEIDADALDKMWGEAKKAKNLVKFGGGFYCAKLEKDGKGPFYVFNGFFMTMRSGYVKEGASIYYYVVEWDTKSLPWSDFRGKVLGPTDPADAPKDSLRGGAYADWENLGLTAQPNVGENCIHASASPFEALCERMNWLGYKSDRDNFGKALLAAGVRLKTIKDWSLDPVVSYGDKLDPTSKSIWDTLEDMDSKECIDKCAEIDAWRPGPKNTAFVFLKPAAVTDKMKELVKSTLEKKGLKILKEGSIAAADIDKKQLIDKHYYAIASKATLLTPDKLNVPADKFKEQFGLEWADVLKDGKALNAKEACEKFEIDADALDKMWGEAKKAKNLVKFGGGFYCAKLEKDGKGPFYVFNGFFMTMRSTYVKEGASIYYCVVEWAQKELSWADFRGKVLGPTDPAEAPKDSLRGGALADWKNLGLPEQPNVGENCVHASASPFEGLAERMNWLGYRADRDNFGKALLEAGVRLKTIKDWCLDPAVSSGSKLNPTVKSIWDTIEDMDAQACIEKCAEIDAWRPLKKPRFGKVGKVKPEQKGVNLHLKCVTEATAVDGGEIKEATCGDDTGSIIVAFRNDAQAAVCKAGACIRVQNAHITMVKGFIRLTIDKWALIKAQDSVEFDKVDESNNVSKTEFELA